uniref:Uncharacterized protein n=1 Tax=Cacopsylla melanoneura TaxID=428564 RepID=A0A8D9FB45_9HEMI
MTVVYNLQSKSSRCHKTTKTMDANPITNGLDLNYGGCTTNLPSSEWTDASFLDLVNRATKYVPATEEQAEIAVAHFMDAYFTGNGLKNVSQCLLILFYGAKFKDGSPLVTANMVGQAPLPVLEEKGWSDESGYIGDPIEGRRVMQIPANSDFMTGIHELEASHRILLVTFIAFTCFRCCVKDPVDVKIM